ncbi:hypothetical protein N7499_008849 [Penicillium canescens]|nr:hypothetical protein N7499_008849 [Penicillium canescens]
MCAVALEVTSKKIVFECMQSVFQSDAEFKSLRTRIHGAKWANRAIHLLSRTEWGSRSWDLIYAVTAANNQVNFYRQFNDYSITPDDLIGRLKMEFNPEDTQTISVPLAIPSIIQTIFRDLVPLEKICECLGYELCDYNKLDLSGLEKLLAVSANADLNDTEPIDTEPTNTVPNDAEPNDVGPNDAETNDAGPNKKRKSGPLKTSSKRRCRNVSSGSPEGHYFGISNGSHWSNHATPAPSEPGSDSVMGGLFEEFPTSTSSPAEVSLDIDASEEMDYRLAGYNNTVGKLMIYCSKGLQQIILNRQRRLTGRNNTVGKLMIYCSKGFRRIILNRQRRLTGRNNTVGKLMIYCSKGLQQIILNRQRRLTGRNNTVGKSMIYCSKGFRRIILNHHRRLSGGNNTLPIFCSRIFR